MLAPMGVRYVALPEHPGHRRGSEGAPAAALSTASPSQLDLARLRSEPGLRALREPRVGPAQAAVAGCAVGGRAGRLARPAPAPRCAVDLTDADRWRQRRSPGHGAVGRGLRLALGGDVARHRPAPRRGVRLVERLPAHEGRGRRLAFTDQWQRWALLGGALVIWLVCVLALAAGTRCGGRDGATSSRGVTARAPIAARTRSPRSLDEDDVLVGAGVSEPMRAG